MDPILFSTEFMDYYRFQNTLAAILKFIDIFFNIGIYELTRLHFDKVLIIFGSKYRDFFFFLNLGGLSLGNLPFDQL